MPRYKLTIEYDGAAFFGWQRQPGCISVQEIIADAVKAIFKQDVLVEGAGRTDAGVHALGQVAHIDLAHEMPGYRICDGLNHYLRDRRVTILAAEIVPDTFHARFSAIGRVYEYHIINRRAPLILEANQAWHVIVPLNLKKMQEAAQHFLGTHDFTSFRATLCQSPSPVKTLDLFELTHKPLAYGSLITAHIGSRSFLHNQVRIMMGTIKLVGEGRLHPDQIPGILQARDRKAGGPTAPPQGLYLKSVAY